jgi:hypothetical protein
MSENKNNNNQSKRKKQLMMVAGVSAIAVVLIASFAINGFQQGSPAATAISQRKPLPFHVFVDAPLNSPDGAMQIITVQRGSSVTIPVHVETIGKNIISNLTATGTLPIALQVIPDYKLDANLQPITTKNAPALPTGVTATLSKANLDVTDTTQAVIDLTFTASPDAETGTFMQKIAGITPQGQKIGTVIYLQIT